MKVAVFWDVALCGPYVNRHFRGTYRLHLQGRKLAEQETGMQQVPRQLLHATQCYIPEDDNVHVSTFLVPTSLQLIAGIAFQQVLHLLSGDSEDHAVLLCCFFMHLSKKAWLLLGTGIPHGPTAYVLTREGEQHKFSYWLWDPASGQRYSIHDSFCPLQKVFCLINDENVSGSSSSFDAARL
jgi:hypothetical protein